MDRLIWLNSLPYDTAKSELTCCCGSVRWVEEMVRLRPFETIEEILQSADQVWSHMEREDILEAFSHHPKIGDIESLRERWTKGEQKGVTSADEEVLKGLALGNLAYESQFGYIFIVCATGKSAQEMLSLLQERLQNDPNREWAISANEQRKIIQIRLQKLLALVH